MDEKRREPRQRAFKGGRIVFGDPPAVYDCLIKSRSTNGAKLVVASHAGIPDVFDLMEASGMRHAVKVVWRSVDMIGVEFV
jgi:hypothetical protein